MPITSTCIIITYFGNSAFSIEAIFLLLFVWVSVKCVNTHFFLFLGWARGGVLGRPMLRPEYSLRLSAGFSIWNEHIRVSSTDMSAPENKKISICYFLSTEVLTCMVDVTRRS